MRYNADYWYRQQTDPEQETRHGCQMSAGHETEQDALAEVAQLQAHGYTVQRVSLQTVCTTCTGAGRIGQAPKGTRKATIASMPAWRLQWRTCGACQGNGYTETRELLD